MDLSGEDDPKQKKGKIADNPSVSEFRSEITSGKMVAKFIRFIGKIGLAKEGMIKTAEDFLETAEKNDFIFDLPDLFNKLFAVRGWIFYSSMNAEVAKRAVELGESGEIDSAEMILVEYYNEETIRFFLPRLNSPDPFRSRKDLIEKYYIDYINERHHASIPGILMMLDGIAFDLGLPSFYKQKSQFIQFDTIVGHHTGLNKLSEVMGEPRKKTYTKNISIPFRHGILHGRDLAFDNKLVAAKCWAALFALHEWAIEKVHPPKIKEKVSWRTLFDQRRSIHNTKQMINAWKAREIIIGKDIPEAGTPEQYPERSPERTAVEFLFFLKNKNYGGVAESIEDRDNSPLGNRAGKYRARMIDIEVVDWKLDHLEDVAPAVTEIKVVITLMARNQKQSKALKLRLLFLDKEHGPLVRSNPAGNWKILDLSLFDLWAR